MIRRRTHGRFLVVLVVVTPLVPRRSRLNLGKGIVRLHYREARAAIAHRLSYRRLIRFIETVYGNDLVVLSTQDLVLSVKGLD
jgi:hypothetical protein